MFPSKLPWPIMLQSLIVAGIALAIIFWTNNPLGALVLMMLPQIPILQEDDEPQGEGEPAIGFLSSVGPAEEWDD